MLKLSETSDLQAIISIPTDAGDVNIGYVNARVPKNGNDISISKVIQNIPLFNANKENILKDIAEFEKYVYSLVE